METDGGGGAKKKEVEERVHTGRDEDTATEGWMKKKRESIAAVSEEREAERNEFLRDGETEGKRGKKEIRGDEKEKVHTKEKAVTDCRVFYSQRGESALLVCDVAEWIWREMKAQRRIEEAGTGTSRRKESERVY